MVKFGVVAMIISFVCSDIEAFQCRIETGLFLVMVLFTVSLPLLGSSSAEPTFSSSLMLHRLVVVPFFNFLNLLIGPVEPYDEVVVR